MLGSSPRTPGTPIKILHVLYSLSPGGMENGVVNLANTLDTAQFDIHFCSLESRGAFAQRLPDPSKLFALGKRSGFSPWTAVQLARHISSVKPDLIHSHNLGALIYSSLASLGGCRAPILHGEHSQFTQEECSPRRLRQRRWLYRTCRHVHTVSQGMRAELVDLGFPASKISVVYNGVDAQRFAPSEKESAKARLGIPPDVPVIGIFGRFGPAKGHLLLIEAFESLSFGETHLLIVGDGGPLREAVQRRVFQSRKASQIHWCGFHQDTRPFYHALDLLVIPSSNEGLSNVLLEAMASGIPVLASSACGNSEVITPSEDGFLCSIETPKILTTILEKLLKNLPGLHSTGQRARKKVQANFSLQTMASNYADLYRRTLGYAP